MKRALSLPATLLLGALISFSQQALSEPIYSIALTSVCSTAQCSGQDFSPSVLTPDVDFSNSTMNITPVQVSDSPAHPVGELLPSEGFVGNADPNSFSLSYSVELNDRVSRPPDTKCTIHCPPGEVPEPESAFLIISALGGIAIKLRGHSYRTLPKVAKRR